MYPLGGIAPSPPVPQPESRRHVAVGVAVVAVGVLAAVASLMTWRVWGASPGPQLAESGWERYTGGLGRGPLAMLLGLLLACVGGAIAVGYRPRYVRYLGVAASTGLVALAVLEWGLGGRDVPNSPGMGLWLVLFAGVVGLFPFAALEAPGPGSGDSRVSS